MIVHHAPFAGMPAMTMGFGVRGARDRDAFRHATSAIRVGDVIDASVEMSGVPWRLADIRRLGRAASRTPATQTPYVPVLQIDDAVPDVPLVDQRGRRLTLQAFAGRALIVGFIYTRCRDPRMCPLVTAKFVRMQRRLAGAPIHLVELTLDPAADTPPVLARYGAAVGADPEQWSLATGDPPRVRELAERLGVSATPDARGGIVHAEAAIIVGPDGRIVDRIDGNDWTAEETIAAARAALRLSTNPLARLALALSRGAVALCGRSASSGITVGAAIALFVGVTFVLALGARHVFHSLFEQSS
jgi:protein SCO1/2